MIVIETIEGRRSSNRPVLPQDKWDEQVDILKSRGVKSPTEKKRKEKRRVHVPQRM